MVNFELYRPTKVIFGKDTEKNVGQYVSDLGCKKVLIHFGQSSAEKSGLLGVVRASLKEKGIAFCELGGVQPNPRASLIRKGVELCRKEGVDFILAVGGGSVIDSAKGIAVGVPYDGDFYDFYHNDKLPTESVPVGCILTMPGAGSEGSNSSVVTDDEAGTKNHCDYEGFICEFAILDPELTKTIPVKQTIYGVVDAISHLYERYFTNTTNVEVTDRLIEGLLKALMKMGKLIIDDPLNYDYRAEIMLACKLAHDNSLGIGREQDWATHMIEHQLSAVYDVPHGAGLAVLFPAWMKYTFSHDPRRFAQLAVRVFDLSLDVPFDESAIEALGKKAITAYEDFLKSVGMPTRMHELCPDADDAAYELMADKCIAFVGDHAGSFVPLKHDDIAKIYKLAE